MKLGELIKKVDQNKTNVFTYDQKIDWINVLEGRIQTEILNKDENITSYVWPKDQSTELIVTEPYTNLYVYYLYAMIDFESNEINQYNNDMALFNEAWDIYSAYARKKSEKLSYIKNYW